MRVLFAVFAFLMSRRWLVANLAVNGAIIWLMIAMPFAPAIERYRPRFGNKELSGFDKFHSLPIQDPGFDARHVSPRRGTTLTGTRDDESNGQAVKITAQPDEFHRQRR